jgi:hypothetical protein
MNLSPEVVFSCHDRGPAVEPAGCGRVPHDDDADGRRHREDERRPAGTVCFSPRPGRSLPQAVAVWGGALGSVGLILRKRWALPAVDRFIGRDRRPGCGDVRDDRRPQVAVWLGRAGIAGPRAGRSRSPCCGSRAWPMRRAGFARAAPHGGRAKPRPVTHRTPPPGRAALTSCHRASRTSVDHPPCRVLSVRCES